jgi:hypothetical protein
MTPQRFLDHAGWRRNRRAVRVADDALVIERFIGGEVIVPWVDVVGLHWAGADRLSLATPERRLVFDRRVEGLEALAQAVTEARSAVEAAPGAADVARWLGEEYHVVARFPARSRGCVAEKLLTMALFVAVWYATEEWLEPWLGWERAYGRFGLLLYLLMLAAPVVGCLALFDGLKRHLPARWQQSLAAVGDAKPRCTLTVDAGGVSVQWPSRRRRRLAWDQIAHCEAVNNGLLLTRRHGSSPLLIPDEPVFHDAIAAIRRVMSGLDDVNFEDVPPPPGALSRVHLTGEEPADDRGLSRVEPEDAP